VFPSPGFLEFHLTTLPLLYKEHQAILLERILHHQANEKDWEGFNFVNSHIQPTSICGLGAVAGRLIKQTMQKFPEEWEKYKKSLQVNV